MLRPLPPGLRDDPPVPRARLLELLGLPMVATPDEIKARYRELARRHHPDVNGGDERAHARFRAIAAAYQQLVDGDAAPIDDGGPATPTAAPPTAAPPASAPAIGDGLDRRRAELRTRLAHVTRSFRRTQADARDGATKAVAARARGDEAMARHFERRVEADWGRADGLRGEIAAIKHELRLLAGGPGPSGAARANYDSRSG